MVEIIGIIREHKTNENVKENNDDLIIPENWLGITLMQKKYCSSKMF